MYRKWRANRIWKDSMLWNVKKKKKEGYDSGIHLKLPLQSFKAWLDSFPNNTLQSSSLLLTSIKSCMHLRAMTDPVAWQSYLSHIEDSPKSLELLVQLSTQQWQWTVDITEKRILKICDLRMWLSVNTYFIVPNSIR